MRFRLFLAPAVGALALIATAAQTASACHWWKWGHRHHGPAYYYAPAPTYYAPPMYHVPPPHPMPDAPRPMPAMPKAAPTTAATVGMADDRFDPPTLTVAPGTTVKWTNNGRHPHTVTDRGGKFDSGDVAPGGTYSVTFQTPGTYKVYCKHHKGMEGTIVVGATGPAPAAR